MELNEAALIESEFTIRSLRLSKEVMETRRSIIRWLALSLGVINPGESRLSSLSVLDALVYFQFTKNVDPEVAQLVDYIKKNWEEINEKTLRYHLLRMKKMGIVENSKGRFYFKPPAVGERFDASNWINSFFESKYKDVGSKVVEVLKELKAKNYGVVE
ncbi:MAG: hypothetical protein KGI00_00670 [Candidatus Micrarchaeota archaeon]|nr:hypothetical protein [Candidatus Micrarchaeota archaeon]MDE1849226.1 hypothetical protein [Candidatus Micrarchaeota archaeon]